MSRQSLQLPADLIAKLAKVSLSPRGMIRGRMQGKRRSRQMGSSLEFADYRVYTPGDDLRQLDWNVYARTSKPFIKLFLDEQEMQVHLFVDATASMDFGQHDSTAVPSKLTFAKQLAACIGYISLSSYDRVSASVLGPSQGNRLPLLRGRGMFARLVQFLSELEAVPGGSSTNEAKRLIAPALLPRNPGMSWVFSDFLYEDGARPLLNALIERKQQVVVVHILSPEEIDPQFSGDLNMIDSETNVAKEVAISGPVLKAYRKERDRFMQSVQKTCYELNIPYVFVPTDRSLEECVLGAFRKLRLLE